MKTSGKSDTSGSNPNSTERLRKHRAERKRRGLRAVQMWLPDTKDPKFREECRRQATLIAAAEGAKGKRRGKRENVG
jgi:hypothetical protein